MDNQEKITVEDFKKLIGSGLSIVGIMLPLLILIGTFSIFAYGVADALDASSHGYPMAPVLWSYAKCMLIFVATSLILMVALHLAQFSIWLRPNDVLDAIITAAYAITLIGVHRGIIKLLDEEKPLSLDTYILFLFLAFGGCFMVAMLFAKKKLTGG